MSSVSTSGSGAPKSSFSFGRIWDQYGMLVVFAVLFIACAIPVSFLLASVAKNFLTD